MKMPLIWNNKEYKLVSDNSRWDKLEFVVARKLHVQYGADQVICQNSTWYFLSRFEYKSDLMNFIFTENFD